MSEFMTEVVKIDAIEPHPNADRLDLAVIYGYRTVIQKGAFKAGDLVAYIQAGSVMPQELMDELGLELKNGRVKEIKLRGILSEGVCYPARPHWKLGDDVSQELGITKYEQPVHYKSILSTGAGRVPGGHVDRCIRYDINNIKKFKKYIEDGEEVVFTEKLHGSWAQFGVYKDVFIEDDPELGWLAITSKGIAKSGQLIKPTHRCAWTLVREQIQENLNRIREDLDDAPIFVLGEVFGPGVQDLTYGLESVQFRVFDVWVGHPKDGRYLDHDEMLAFCHQYDLDTVPVMYQGPFSYDKVLEYTSGKDQITASHIREGIVVKPVKERLDYRGNRVQYKSVSDEYLTRKNGTEYQ